MKRFLLLAISLFFSALCNAQFTDDFTDGDFTSNPIWSGQDTFFIINGSNQLQSAGPDITDEIYLSTPNTQYSNTEWSFYSFHDLGLTTNNNARVYLMSDNANLKDSLHGYYVQLGGESGIIDGIHLYRQDGNSTTKIIDGPDGTMGLDPNTARIKVLRDAIGNWSLFADTSGGTNYALQGSTFDDSYTSTSHFGVTIKQTKTNKNNFYFDEFSIIDLPITLVEAIPLNDGQVEVHFTEGLELTTSQNNTNYSINNGIGNPTSAIIDQNNSIILLDLAGPLTDGVNYTLTVNNVVSLVNDTIADNSTTSFSFFKPNNFNDIVITEIMPDPEPSVALPIKEYVEFYNTTSGTINLEGFTFTDASTTVATLGEFNLTSKSYLIICAKSDTNTFKPYGEVLGISNFPSLNNSGDDLQLFDRTGKLIDEANYLDSWYGDEVKKDGGWSLEIVDPLNPCGEDGNWSASVDASGGTPGKINSINASNPDLTAPELSRIIAVNDSTLIAYFNEKLDASSINNSDFGIDNGINVKSFSVNIGSKELELIVSPILTPKTVYNFTVSNLTDCIGNLIGIINTGQFSLPESPEIGDIIINEVLFNPQSGGDDFVEVYNNSDKYINLIDFNFIEFDLEEDTITNTTKGFTSDYYIIAPNEYAWLTEAYSDVVEFFPKAIEENVLITDLPSYSDKEGVVAIAFIDNGELKLTDKFIYNEKYHYELLDDDNGVSLERITFDGETNNANNWHSASVAENYGTPGYQNSQQLNIAGIEDQIAIFPEVFTPDEDGDKDFTTINYSFDDNGYTLSLTIFDSHGRLIKNIAQNELVGREGFYQWNGVDNEGQKASVGYYIALVEVFDLNGNTYKFKKRLVVGARF